MRFCEVRNIVTDYADDAVFITPRGVRYGKDGVRAGFAELMADLPGAKWDVPTQIFEGDVLSIPQPSPVPSAGCGSECIVAQLDQRSSDRGAGGESAQLRHYGRHGRRRAQNGAARLISPGAASVRRSSRALCGRSRRRPGDPTEIFLRRCRTGQRPFVGLVRDRHRAGRRSRRRPS
jgi:hypothetical protein